MIRTAVAITALLALAGCGASSGHGHLTTSSGGTASCQSDTTFRTPGGATFLQQNEWAALASGTLAINSQDTVLTATFNLAGGPSMNVATGSSLRFDLILYSADSPNLNSYPQYDLQLTANNQAGATNQSGMVGDTIYYKSFSTSPVHLAKPAAALNGNALTMSEPVNQLSHLPQDRFYWIMDAFDIEPDPGGTPVNFSSYCPGPTAQMASFPAGTESSVTQPTATSSSTSASASTAPSGAPCDPGLLQAALNESGGLAPEGTFTNDHCDGDYAVVVYGDGSFAYLAYGSGASADPYGGSGWQVTDTGTSAAEAAQPPPNSMPESVQANLNAAVGLPAPGLG